MLSREENIKKVPPAAAGTMMNSPVSGFCANLTPMPPPGMDTVGLNPPGLSVVVEVGTADVVLMVVVVVVVVVVVIVVVVV